MALTLTSVALVLLDQQDGDALLQLGPLVSTFLGPSPHLSLSEACAFASTSLLDWMWSLSCTSVGRRASGWRLANYLRSEPHYYQWQFWKAMKVAAERGDLALLSWLFAHFSRCVEVVEVAAKNGHLEVLQFLLEHDAGRYSRHRHTATTKHTGIQSENDDVSFHSVPEVESKRRGAGHVVRWGGRSIVLAIQNGYPAVGKWLYRNVPHVLSADEVKAAVEAAEFFVPPGKTLLDYAKSYPQPGTIEKLLESGYLRESTECAAHVIRRLVRTECVD